MSYSVIDGLVGAFSGWNQRTFCHSLHNSLIVYNAYMPKIDSFYTASKNDKTKFLWGRLRGIAPTIFWPWGRSPPSPPWSRHLCTHFNFENKWYLVNEARERHTYISPVTIHVCSVAPYGDPRWPLTGGHSSKSDVWCLVLQRSLQFIRESEIHIYPWKQSTHYVWKKTNRQRWATNWKFLVKLN